MAKDRKGLPARYPAVLCLALFFRLRAEKQENREVTPEARDFNQERFTDGS